MSTLGFAGSITAASLPLAGCAPGPVAGPGVPLKTFTAREWATLDAAGRTLWPDLPGLPGAGLSGAALRADALLADANPRLLADLRRLLGAVESLTWLNGRLTPFTGLDAAARTVYLASWRDGWFAVQHQAFAALVRLTGLLTYVAPETWPGIGYPGPWKGRINVGLGLDNALPLAVSPNPHVFAPWTGA